ncbi:MAG: tetratricopeptide repeat protein [Acidobacteriota bacterium]
MNLTGAMRSGVGVLILLGSSVAWAQTPLPVPGEPAEFQPAPRVDRARSYYHYMLGRRYRELARAYNRMDMIERSISEYRQAIEADPDSLFLRTELAELYASVAKSEDAVRECEQVLKVDPENVDAHRLLGNIYLRAVGNRGSRRSSQGNIRKAIPHFEIVVRKMPDDSDSLFTLARLYRMNNQIEKAEEAFKKMLATRPRSRRGLDNLAQLYSDRGDYEQVIELLDKTPQEDLSNQLLAALAFAYHQTGKLEEATRHYESALEREPDNQQVRQIYARVLVALQDFERAKPELERLLEDGDENGEANRLLSEVLRREGNFEEAEEAIERAREAQPENIEILYSAIDLMGILGREKEAITLIAEFLESTKKDSGNYTVGEAANRAVFLERLGLSYRTLEKFPSALDAFDELRALGPTQGPRAETLISETHRISGDLPKALKIASEAVKKYPDSRQLRLLRASLLGLDGKIKEAIAQLNELRSENGEDRELLLAIGQVYFQARELEAAAEWTRQAVALSEGKPDSEYGLFLLGSIYERQKKFDLAEKQFKRVLEMNPFNAGASNYLGYMLADRGIRLEESVRYIQKALQMEPKNGAYLDSLGWAYFKMNKYNLAEIHLEEAARRITHDPTIHEHLGYLYYSTGRTKQARDAWKRALETWPEAKGGEFDSFHAQELRERLEGLKKASGSR